MWINVPPMPSEFAGIRLYRLTTRELLMALITSDHLVGCNTHFTHGQTQPCVGPDCPYCLDGLPARWHGYLSIWCIRRKTTLVLELTAQAAQPLHDYHLRNGGLRGAKLLAERTGSKPNSPVNCQVVPNDTDHRLLPHPVNLERFLATLWHLEPQRETGQDEPPPGPNIRNTIHASTPGQSSQPSHPQPTGETPQ